MTSVRWSELKNIAVSPAYYQWRLKNPIEATPAMRLGSLIHCMALAKVPHSFVAWEGPRRGKAWLEFKEQHAGVDIVSAAEWERACEASQAFRSHDVVKPLLEQTTHVERRIEWDSEFGFHCHGTPDLSGRALIDLKVTPVAPAQMRWHLAKMLWHAQVVWYFDALKAIGEPADSAFIVTVAPEPPHEVNVYLLDDEALDVGRGLYMSLLEKLRYCADNDSWPPACTEPLPLSMYLWSPEP